MVSLREKHAQQLTQTIAVDAYLEPNQGTNTLGSGSVIRYVTLCSGAPPRLNSTPNILSISKQNVNSQAMLPREKQHIKTATRD